VQFLAAIANYPKHLIINELIIGSIRVPAQKKYEIRSKLIIAGYINSMEDEMPVQSAAVTHAEALKEQIASIDGVLFERDRNLDILRELTRVLPPDTYLNTYVNRNGMIQLSGISGSSHDLIRKLDESPWFKNIMQKAPFREQKPGVDMFNMEATLEQ
jgi:hypothetical protein